MLKPASCDGPVVASFAKGGFNGCSRWEQWSWNTSNDVITVALYFVGWIEWRLNKTFLKPVLLHAEVRTFLSLVFNFLSGVVFLYFKWRRNLRKTLSDSSSVDKTKWVTSIPRPSHQSWQYYSCCKVIGSRCVKYCKQFINFDKLIIFLPVIK